MSEVKNYDFDVQKLYLEMMLSDAETFVRCQGIFDHTLFDRKLQDAAQFMNEYTKKYSVLPDFDTVNASCKTDLKEPGELKEGHLAWLMDEFESFTRHKALERAIINSADLNYQSANWIETIAKRGQSKGKCNGWITTLGESFVAKIVKSMSHQLWVDIETALFTEEYILEL